MGTLQEPPAPRTWGPPRMLGSPRQRAAAPTPHPEHSAPGVTAAASHSQGLALQVHPPRDTKASWLPARQAVWTCFLWLPEAPSVQQGYEIRTGPDNPGRPETLEQGADTQQAWPPAPTLQPQQTLQGSHPARPLLPGTCRLTSGRLHQVQACVTRGVEGSASELRGLGLEPTGARARCAGPAGASPGAFTGLGFPGTSCPAGGRSRCAPGPGGPSRPQAGLAGCRGRGWLPRTVAGPRASASILHVHSFPEPSPGVEPSVVGQQPWSDQ